VVGRAGPSLCRALLAQKLGIFLFLPDGSRLAMWDHGGTESAVVLIGSEGELENLAPSLDELLQRRRANVLAFTSLIGPAWCFVP
jgi:hypothetical protein